MQSPKAQDAPYTMDMVLAGVDELSGTPEAKKAAKTYLRRDFCMNGDGRFFVMNHISFISVSEEIGSTKRPPRKNRPAA
mgnify:CR=1 FL=1